MVGTVIGAVGVEAYHRTALTRSRELFNQKLRCSSLGQNYATENSSSIGPTLRNYTLNRVDFSESRNSCIAEIIYSQSMLGRPDLDIWNVQIVDLATKELLMLNQCANGPDCSSAFQRTGPEFDKLRGVRNPR
jgi:hypothetical protein